MFKFLKLPSGKTVQTTLAYKVKWQYPYQTEYSIYTFWEYKERAFLFKDDAEAFKRELEESYKLIGITNRKVTIESF